MANEIRTKRRMLLVAGALATQAAACDTNSAKGPDPRPEPTEVPLPGNPKGSRYDEGVNPPPPGDAGEPADPGDAGAGDAGDSGTPLRRAE